MPRTARKKSRTGVYHVVIKGIDRQSMFEESKDYQKYLEILQLYSYECDFDIFAYCLMTNHIHIIIREKSHPIETIFRKINTNYSVWFNMKYQRTGHLQQDRYYSEPIEDFQYLLAAIRYVHQNPVKAGLEPSPGTTYLWSSIYEYISQQSHLTNIDFIFNHVSVDEFIAFNKIDNTDKFIDIDNLRRRLPDDVAKELILSETGCKNSTEFQKLNLLTREKYIIRLTELGLSSRQLNRLTGISRGVIERTVLRNKRKSDTPSVIKNRRADD